MTWGEALKEASGIILGGLAIIAACLAFLGVVVGGGMLLPWLAIRVGWPATIASGAFLFLAVTAAGVKAGL